MDPDDLTAQIADRRADPDFQARLQERTTQDKPILDRLAALKTVSPEQLAEAIQQAGPSFTFVRAMSGGRLEMTTDRVTADGDPITIYASTAVTGEWHVDDGAETYHRLLRARRCPPAKWTGGRFATRCSPCSARQDEASVRQ